MGLARPAPEGGGAWHHHVPLAPVHAGATGTIIVKPPQEAPARVAVVADRTGRGCVPAPVRAARLRGSPVGCGVGGGDLAFRLGKAPVP